ncbi:MAG: endolytic transglycosylase MltG [Magnetococcales bacterium]|nr:endolytic transglycosylase MltG [Magnetococcales bacterium]
MTNRLQRLLLGLLLAGFLATGILSLLFIDFLTTPLESSRRVVIEKKWYLSRIAQFLEAEQVIPSARWFVLLAHFHRRNIRLHAGEYRFEQGETPPRILIRLEQGDVVRYRFSFPEGLTARDVATRMEEQGWNEASALVRDVAWVKKLAPDVPTLEGWLFPETYFFVRGESAQEMLVRMTRMARATLEREWANRDPGIELTTPLQALILASIIEKETGAASERSRISGVFHNRLRRNMRLESDPTVIYGAADYQGDITRKHLTTPTPYNTYTRSGLPPTPICNPGRASIHAALHPERTDELFFVARGDGSHVFASTFQEHKENVNRYQKRKANVRP